MEHEMKQLVQAEKSLDGLMEGFTNLIGEFFPNLGYHYESIDDNDWMDDVESVRKEHDELMNRLDLISKRSIDSHPCKPIHRVSFSQTVIDIPILNEAEWYFDYVKARQSDWKERYLDRMRFQARVVRFEALLYHRDCVS